MTKRDYIKIAAVLDANAAPLEVVQDMADMLGEDNSLFDRARFIQASTVNIAGAASITLGRIQREITPKEDK